MKYGRHVGSSGFSRPYHSSPVDMPDGWDTLGVDLVAKRQCHRIWYYKHTDSRWTLVTYSDDFRFVWAEHVTTLGGRPDVAPVTDRELLSTVAIMDDADYDQTDDDCARVAAELMQFRTDDFSKEETYP